QLGNFGVQRSVVTAGALINFIIHEIHCRRNIEICPYCSDSIPKSEMKNHIESEHVQASSCPLRPVLCQFCDIQLAFKELQEHELYCGARTEPCGRCGRNVLRRELPEHPRLCGSDRSTAGDSGGTAPAPGRQRGAGSGRHGAGTAGAWEEPEREKEIWSGCGTQLQAQNPLRDTTPGTEPLRTES
uniref:TRAF-type zinc finger domain-containing protein 1 n=1 Tax=Taeniopygia guttata TaxID=59729 RepID=A0A674H7H5_TAEGU